MTRSYSRLEASQAADALLKKHNVVSAPVPVERLAKLEGVLVQRAELDDALSGMVYIRDGLPIIGVNSRHHENRQRFTIAHELGHLLMHRTYIEAQIHVDTGFTLRRDSVSATGTDAYEIEANVFAAHLLMPTSWIEDEAKESELDDEQGLAILARRFKVSVAALSNRLLYLS